MVAILSIIYSILTGIYFVRKAQNFSSFVTKATAIATHVVTQIEYGSKIYIEVTHKSELSILSN